MILYTIFLQMSSIFDKCQMINAKNALAEL